MNERKTLVEEYFKLRVLLNRANKKPDEKTEVKFVIESSGNQMRLLATLIGESTGASVELCSCRRYRIWERSGLTELKHFEEFCAQRLQHYLEVKSFTDLQREQLCESLISDLMGLLHFEE